jgi:hypothetical protein
MTDEIKSDARSLWKHRRFYGGLCVGLAGVLFTMGAPVIATIGTVTITLNTVATLLTFAGTYVFGWGQGKAEERNKNSKNIINNKA